MRKQLMIGTALLSIGLFLAGCGENESVAKPEEKPKQEVKQDPVKKKEVKQQTTVPSYKISEERLDKSGVWYVTFSTPSTDKKELEALVNKSISLAVAKNKDIQSIFAYTIREGSESTAYTSLGKVALTQKGLAQTGLEKIKTVEFEYKGPSENKALVNDNTPSEKSGKFTADEIANQLIKSNFSSDTPKDVTEKFKGSEGLIKALRTSQFDIYEYQTSQQAAKYNNPDLNTLTRENVVVFVKTNDIDTNKLIEVLNSMKPIE